VAPRFSEAQQQQRESTARCALEQLVELLTDAARDICIDPKFGGRNRALALGRGATLFAAIDRVSKALSAHPDAGVRADLLVDLHDAIEAAVILADGVKKVPVAHRLRTAFATETRLNKVRKPEVTNIICEEFEKFRKQYPDWRPNTPRRGAHYVAEFLYKPVNTRITKLIRMKKKSPELKTDTIARYLREQYPDLFMSD
jgi:hypothetical protein